MNKQATREAARNAEALERPIDDEPMNLIDRVEHEMHTDMEDREDQAQRLLRIYETGSVEVRTALDDGIGKATSVAEARAKLKDTLDAADSNLGAWDDGDPILAEVSLHHIKDLYLIDGKEAVALAEADDQECEECGGSGEVATGYRGTP